MKRIIVGISFSLLLFFGCRQQPVEVKVLAPVKELQKKYAPDKRVAVFDIRTYEQGKDLVVAGDVEQQEAKQELLTVLRGLYPQVIDSVSVLPDEKLGAKRWGIITVSVANMRSDPGEDAELGSQVLMGSIVRILKKKGGWVYIQSPDKYIGWADPDQMIRVTEEEANSWNSAQKVFVTAFSGNVHTKPSESSFPVCDLTGGAVLKKIGTTGEWVNVALADGRSGYVKRTAVMEKELWGTKLVPEPENIERTGRFLMGVPYLWGGTSPKGVDCSGFTKTVYLLNGQQLNRDANQQAEQGEPVEPGKDFEHLKKGDLLFYGRKAENGRSERIVHVGIYLGNKEYIHSSGKVQINSFDPASPLYNEYNLKRFVRARRVIASTPNVAEIKLR
jgi:hypothetical protein